MPVRNCRQNEEHFSKTTAFLFDSIGSTVSPKKITSTLQSKSGISLSHNTVISYISALAESYMFYKVNRFDLRGRGLPDSN